MRKIIGRITAITMAIIMLVTVVPTNGMVVEAAKKPKLVKKSTSIVIGQTNKVKVKNVPKGAKITYNSSNRKIATVSKKGKIKGIKPGTAKIKITVKAKNRRTKLTYRVTVKKPKISKSQITVTVGKTEKLSVKNRPKAATYAWNSNNSRVATVSNNGVVTAKSKGTATITVKVKANKKTYTLSSNVTVKSSVSTVNNNKSKLTITFDSNGGSQIASQTVEEGGKAEKPINPTKSGFIFAGWFIDKELNVEYDFSAIITENIILYAKWVEVSDNLNDGVIDLGDLEHLDSQGIVDVIYDEKGNVHVVDGNFTDKKVESTEEAAEVLNMASPLFDSNKDGFYASEENIAVQEINNSSMPDRTDGEFYCYSPTIAGIPVSGSQIILTTKAGGEVSGLFSTYNDSIENVDVYPYIDEDEVKQIVYDKIIDESDINSYIESGEINKSDIGSLFDVSVELLIDFVNDGQEPVLAYKVIINGFSGEIGDGTLSDFDKSYYVYANGSNVGQIFKVLNNNKDVRVELTSTDLALKQRTYVGELENETYFLKDKGRNIETYKADRITRKKYIFFGEELVSYKVPGTIASAPQADDMEKVGVSAHSNMSSVYDYYKNVLNRDSYDGDGKKIIVSYNYHDNKYMSENAFWSKAKKQFVFVSSADGGDSIFVKALDVMGHEFTHAVIDYTVGGLFSKGLKYEGETGALNESYADIMGSLIEEKDGEDRWLIGEDSITIRDMADPSKYRQPENYSEFDSNYESDNGGVHHYSGIFNYAAYKMMNSDKTSNISKGTWAKIFYHSLFRLTSDAKFLDARGAVLATAKAYGFNEEQLEAVKKAFDDVGIKEPDSVRIVLTWGAEPSDLDSHLVGPGIGLFADRFHIYYSQKSYYMDGSYNSNTKQYAADLDYDDTTSFGPEITTIHALTPGDYYFYVHDYSNGYSHSSTEMAKSGAKVKVYYNDSHTLKHTFDIKPNSSGTIWNVFKLTVDRNKDISISEINSYGSEEIYN